jgi:hypothetical protein
MTSADLYEDLISHIYHGAIQYILYIYHPIMQHVVMPETETASEAASPAKENLE